MKIPILFTCIFLAASSFLIPQTKNESGTLLKHATLQDCINYAITNQPTIRQSLLNEKITNQEINTKLADWFPQLNFNFNLQHNYKLPTSIFQGRPVHFGVVNTSSGDFSLTETIFNRDVLLASSTAHDVRLQAKQTTINNKINLAVNVSKAFYGVLLAEEQINLTREDITRLQQSYNDAYFQFKSGIVDKTDYEQAKIELNNAAAQLKGNNEQLKASYAVLKDEMGYPSGQKLNLVYDTAKMEQDAIIDTTRQVEYSNRIEYKLLQTDLSLQKANLSYYYWSFLPSLSIFGDYNLQFQNDKLPNLYNVDYPSAYAGIQLSLPIFQGGKRFQQIEEASLQVQSSEYDIASLKNSIDAEYTQALGSYESNLSSFNAAKQNLVLAKDVYNTVELQYKAGVKTYLDVITAETDLRTTEVNYYNSLYQLLSSKLDVEKALGTVKY